MDSFIEVNDLIVTYKMRGRRVKAIDQLSLTIFPGETLGVVGESGSGKSTLGRALVQLIPATAGEILYSGNQRQDLQIIFQDPYASLNPRMPVRAIISEGLDIHQMGSKAERQRTVEELIYRVGLLPEHLSRYPHELSNGQRQRVAIARALAIKPKFLVCDEVLSALDVTIQAQIIELLKKLQKEFQLTYLFISHDLSAVRKIAHRIAVMHLGKIVELGPVEQVYEAPVHPYTKALFEAIPVPDPITERRRYTLP